MPIKQFKPTSPDAATPAATPSRRFTKKRPEKSLVESLKKRNAGRNNQGRISVRHRGGGNKRLYRRIDWKREKHGIPAKVASIEYDPNRTARIALLHYADGEKRYILAPNGLEVGVSLMSGPDAELRTATPFPLRTCPPERRCTTSSSRPDAAARWSAPPAPPPSSWRRKASTPSSASPAPRCAACASSAYDDRPGRERRALPHQARQGRDAPATVVAVRRSAAPS